MKELIEELANRLAVEVSIVHDGDFYSRRGRRLIVKLLLDDEIISESSDTFTEGEEREGY